ncbi:MAG TPA: hypothetical protein VGI81_13725, partial [Tepidisphaeraceae bacterium]
APNYAGDQLFYCDLLAVDASRTAFRLPPQVLQPKLLRSNLTDAPSGEKLCRWQLAYDLRQVPSGEFVDLIVEDVAPGRFLRSDDAGTTLPIDCAAPTAELTLWIMMPRAKEYKSWRVVRYLRENPDEVERVDVVNEYLADEYSIVAFKLLSVKPDYKYEVQWFYK